MNHSYTPEVGCMCQLSQSDGLVQEQSKLVSDNSSQESPSVSPTLLTGHLGMGTTSHRCSFFKLREGSLKKPAFYPQKGDKGFIPPQALIHYGKININNINNIFCPLSATAPTCPYRLLLKLIIFFNISI